MSDSTVKATDAPVAVLHAATGQLEGSAKFAGLILDKEGLISIKRYETKALALPTRKNEVYPGAATEPRTPGLTSADMVQLYKKVISNAKSWAPIEDDLMQITADLDIFAESMIEDGTRAIKFLDQVREKCGGNLKWPELTPSQLTDEDTVMKLIHQTQDKPLRLQSDAYLLTATAITVEYLLEDAEHYYSRALALQQSIKAFKDGLTKVRSLVLQKERQCDKVDTDTGELMKKRDDLVKEVAWLSAEYGKNVGLAFTGIATGCIIVFAITAGIFGAKAEAVRKQKDNLINELSHVRNEIARRNELTRVLNTLSSDLNGLEMIMVHALKGATQLVATWKTITTYLQQSHDDAQKIHTSKDLLHYWISLMVTVEPWKKVKGCVQKLTHVLIQAIEESKRTTRIKGSKCTSTMAIQADLPKVDLEAAKNTMDVITNDYAAINKATFPDHYVYITDIHDACNRGLDQLVDSITDVKVYSEVPPSLEQVNKMIKAVVDKKTTETDPDRIKRLDEQLEKYDAIGDRTIRDIVNKITNEKNDLRDAQESIEDTDFGDQLTKTKEQILQQLAETDKNIAQSEAKMEEAEKNKNELQNTLHTLQKNNLFEENGLGAEGLGAMVILCEARPEMVAALVGLNIFKSIMDVLGDAFNEAQLQKAIDHYADVAKEHSSDMHRSKREKRILEAKHTDITKMEAITQERFKLTQQIKPLIQEFGYYQVALEACMKEDRDFDRAIQLMNSMHQFLNI